jgi:hypothetical protein
MSKKEIVFLSLALVLTIIVVVLPFVLYQTNTRSSEATHNMVPNQLIIKNDQKLHGSYMESSPFVWQGKLKYMIAERDDKKKYYQLAIYDFATKERESVFGKGYGLASAAVIDNTLYVTATKDWFTVGNSEVYLMNSKDLRNFSEPSLILKAADDQKIFNTTITKNSNTGKFILAYESYDEISTPFTIYFLESSDGKKWKKVENAIFGKEIYTACPTIRFIDGYYYMTFTMEKFNDPNCLSCISYVTKIARSKDLRKWETSPREMLIPDRHDEGRNNSDVDFAEHDKRTYIFYAIGDQATEGGLKYAIVDSPINSFIPSYFIKRQ